MSAGLTLVPPDDERVNPTREDLVPPVLEVAPPFRGPYPGLRPFLRDDAPRFFGRGRQINQMLDRLEDRRFLAVVGASGCGKSSLVSAGLLPALETGYLMDALPHWRMVVLRPGDAPMRNLASALHAKLRQAESTDADLVGVSLTLNTLHGGRFGLLEAITQAQLADDTNVLVLVDQFEEIFRYRQKDESTAHGEAVSQSKYERQNESIAFVNLLLTAAAAGTGAVGGARQPVYVLLTMRSDFLGDCDQFQGLPEAINQSQFLTPRMTRDQLREAIVGPLQLFRAGAEPGLVDRILNEIGTDPDQLPLMQHALMRTWSVACDPPDAWKTNRIVLTSAHYLNPRVRGIQQALHLHAEETFAALGDAVPDPQHAAAKRTWKQWATERASPAMRRFAEESARLSRETAPAAHQQKRQLETRFFTRAASAGLSELTFLFNIWQLVPGILHFLFRGRTEAAMSRQQRICERMFRCLSDLNAKGKVIRRLATVQEIADVAGVTTDEATAVAQPFLDPERSFLMADPPGSLEPTTTLDITHEALLRQWQRVPRWIETEQQSAETYRGLVRTMTRQKVRQADYLRPPELTVIEQWDDEQAPNPTWARRYSNQSPDIRPFLAASRTRELTRQFGMVVVFWSVILIACGLYYLWNKSATQERLAQQNLAVNDLTNAGFAVRDHRIADALLWYQRAANNAPKNGTLSRSALRLLGSWSRRIGATLVHDDSFARAEFSPDGLIILTYSGGIVRLWDAHTGRQHSEPLQHQDVVVDVAFSPDGQAVLTGNRDGTARLWDTHSGKQKGVPLQHDDVVLAVAFSPDGQTVLTGSDDIAQLWDARTGEKQGKPIQLKHRVSDVAFNPNGETFLINCDDTIALCNTRSGEKLSESIEHRSTIQTAKFSPDGQWILTGSWDKTARIWNARTGHPHGKPLQHEGMVADVAFSPDSKTVLTGSEDTTAKLWNALTCQTLGEIMKHDGAVMAVAFSSDGKSLLTGSWNHLNETGDARLWDARTGKLRGEPFKHKDDVWDVAFSPNSQAILTNTKGGTTHLWDVRTDEIRCRSLLHDGSVGAVTFSPDGLTALTGSSDNTAQLWNVRTGKPLGEQMRHGDAPVIAVMFSLDGQTVLTQSFDGNVRLWDGVTGKLRDNPLHHEGSTGAVAFSPDGQTVLTGSNDETARLWDVRTGKQRGKSLQHKGPVNAAVFSPDGKTALTGSEDKTARLWDSQTGKQLHEPLQHKESVIALAFSRDGQTVLTGSYDKTAKLWEVRTGKQRGGPLLHEGSVSAVMFSPDGKAALTGSWDKTARLWDVSSGKPLSKPLKHKDWVTGVAFSPDGLTFLTRTGSGRGLPRLLHRQEEYIDAMLWDTNTTQPWSEPIQHREWVSSAAFNPNGQTLILGRRKAGELWDVPPPAANEPERLRLSVEVRTGSTFDEKAGTIRRLTQAEWLSRQKLLWDKFHGPCDVRTWDQVSDAEKLQLRKPPKE